MNPDLKNWFSIATQDLAASEIPRIQEEIVEHFDSATENYQMQGKLENDAQFLALSDLGSPQKAHRKFSSLYFTISDERRIERLFEPIWWARPFGYLVVFIGAIFVLLGILNPSSMKVIPNQNPDVFGITLALVFVFTWFISLFFEQKIKDYFKRKLPRHYFLLIQVFIIFLSFPFLSQLATDLINFANMFSGKGRFSLTAPLIAWLVWLWVKSQLPLTIKTIRRLRA